MFQRFSLNCIKAFAGSRAKKGRQILVFVVQNFSSKQHTHKKSIQPSKLCVIVRTQQRKEEICFLCEYKYVDFPLFAASDAFFSRYTLYTPTHFTHFI